MSATPTFADERNDDFVFPVMNTDEQLPDGVYFRPFPEVAVPEGAEYGFGVFKGEHVSILCYLPGEPVGPYGNEICYLADNVERPTINGRINGGFLNAHYVDDGQEVDYVHPDMPRCGTNSPVQPPPVELPPAQIA